MNTWHGLHTNKYFAHEHTFVQKSPRRRPRSWTQVAAVWLWPGARPGAALAGRGTTTPGSQPPRPDAGRRRTAPPKGRCVPGPGSRGGASGGAVDRGAGAGIMEPRASDSSFLGDVGTCEARGSRAGSGDRELHLMTFAPSGDASCSEGWPGAAGGDWIGSEGRAVKGAGPGVPCSSDGVSASRSRFPRRPARCRAGHPCDFRTADLPPTPHPPPPERPATWGGCGAVHGHCQVPRRT